MKHLSFVVVSVFASTILAGALWFALPAQAVEYFGLDTAGDKSGYAEGEQVTATSLTQKIVSAGMSLILVLFLVLAVYAGIRWMTARGDEEAISTAKGTLEAAIIGFVLVLMAYAITSFVFGRLSNLPSQAGGGGGATSGGSGTGTGCHAYDKSFDLCTKNGCTPYNVQANVDVCISQSGIEKCRVDLVNCKNQTITCQAAYIECVKTTP